MTFFLTLLFALLMLPDTAHAGPVFLAVLSAGGGLGAAFSATAVGGFLTQSIIGRLLLSAALSGLQAALTPKPNPPGIVTESTVTGSTQPLTFTVGLYATAGQLACPPMSHGNVGKTPNAYRNYVVTLGCVPGMSLSRLMINGEYVELGATSDPLYGKPILGRYEGYAWVKFYNGFQTEADPLLLAKYGSDPDRPWSANMVGTGLCYAVLTFRYAPSIWTSGEPGWRFELQGIPLYDPRKDTTVGGSGGQRWNNPASWNASNNPLVQAYNIMRGIEIPDLGVWGGGLPKADLPLSDWFAAMNVCDQIVTRTGGASSPRYRAGYEIKLDAEPAAVIEELFRASATQIAEVGGLFKPRTGGPGLPIYLMSDDDIVITSPQELDPFPGADSRFNGITANAPDPDTVWEPRPAPDLYNAGWEAEDGGKRRVATLDLPACPYPLQVQRVMRAYIKDERRFRRHNLTLPPDAAILEPLDTLAWTSERNGYSTKRFEVSELQDDVVTVLQGVSMREVDPTDYDDPPDFGDVLPAISTVRRPIPAQVLEGFDVFAGSTVDASGNPRRPNLRLVWDGDEQDGVAGIEWEVRLTLTGAHVSRGSTTNVEAGSLRVSAGILADTAYEARARQLATWPVAWTSWKGVTSNDIRLGAADLADEINTAIADAIAEAEAAADAAAVVQGQHNTLVSGFVGDLKTAFTEQTKRAMATSGGWLVDPTFTDWVSGNLNAANWASRAGTSAYAVEAGGDFGGGMMVSAPSGSAEVQVVASSAAAGGLIGANATADYAVLEIDLDYSVGNPDGVAFRVEWSSDGVTWTRGTFGGAATSLGLGTAYGLTAQAGTRQSIRGLWKRPAGVSGHIRLRLYPKLSTVTDAQSMVVHYANLRTAQRADIDAGETYLIASSTPGTSVAYTGAGAAIAGLNAAFSARAGGLEANVTNILGVRADLLTGTAFGALLTQLAVNTGTGLSATVTVQGAAIATLEGNASASLALRVKAGSGGALLELTAADNPTGPASFARIVADDILLAGSVTTKQMLITDGNLFGDSLFLLSKDESVYTRSGLGGTDFDTYTSGFAGYSLPQVLRLKAGIGYNSGNGGRLFHKRGAIEGVPGSSYHFSCYVGVEAGGTAGQTTAVFSIYIYTKAANGTLTYARSAAVSAASNAASGVLSGTFTLGKDENVIVPVFRSVNETGGVTDKGALFNNPALRRMNGGELTVDGSLKTRHFAAEQVITKDLIVDGAVSKQFYMYYGLQNTWTSTTASAIGVGISATVDFADRLYDYNPVIVTFNCALYSAGSGTALLILQRWNGTTWATHDSDFGSLKYTAGDTYPMFRYTDAVWYGGVTISDGSYRIAARKSVSGDANFSIGNMMVSFQQMNK